MIDKEMLAAMQLLLEPINARLDELSELKSDVQQLDQRFSSQLGQVEEKFSSQLGQVEERFSSQLGQVEERFSSRLDQVEEKLSSRLDQVENRMDGLSVLLDLEIRKKIDLLVEGQEALMERLPDPAQADDIEHRLSAVEMVVKVHSRDINDLKKAQ
ncbi:hypothetical protein GMD88_05895 [Pseudoflavonifractor sp. BIOML-A6]|nr:MULTISPECIES: hypothetical protein [unclassified Pseudoflavonifractor]MTQ96837.1 hypothetical protein [Pseudoflavonifractor sp. BIOML-A16]MTR05070.1 hypothetical protein [Pseudoflavonifractor sp. BIOML-A15]MTR32691.1 hypothetical protein [Pseudoflavonifractor sp. BIOML-A14]MTR72085.1 hypothetical protein [Pseudoflavonifractor sp. BIOML-A18]MTS65089.1 hypothetical protein [Pseudoflavonifractor sp. BIOML-A5]MTS70427.1 hypothetical protein [Pseudoflavonifractor sp. BIOML-A8]MTS90913.1 hypoth